MKTGTFFEINVCGPDGKHLFATDSTTRSYSEQQIASLMEIFLEKFPKEEKYKVSITTWKCSGSVCLTEGLKKYQE